MWQKKLNILRERLCVFTGTQYKNIGSECLTKKNEVESLNTTKLDDSERSLFRIAIKLK